MMACGGEDVHLHLFLISALDLEYLPMEWERLDKKRSGCGGEGRICNDPLYRLSY
jgi:hypothetical protein